MKETEHLQAVRTNGSSRGEEGPSSASKPWMSVILVGVPVGLLLAVIWVVATVWNAGEANPAVAGGPAVAANVLSGEPLERLLRNYVTALTQRIGQRNSQHPQKLRAAQLFLSSTMGPSNLGYSVREIPYRAADGEDYSNVEARLVGKSHARELIVIGAHYDSVPGTVGADDNASGVAVMLALAGRFTRQNMARTVVFVGFVNEEPPWFQTVDMGSSRYAQSLRASNERVIAMISLESLGYFSDQQGSQKYPAPLAKLYPDTGNFVAVVGNLHSRKLVNFVHRKMDQAGRIPVEKGAFPEMIHGIGWSDHWSFWRIGVPAVMVTDTAPFRNPHYHRATDLADTLDYQRMARATEALANVITGLANDRGFR